MDSKSKNHHYYSESTQKKHSEQADDTLISDIQLWQEFQSGSEEAFATIYKNNAARLYNYGLKVVNNKDIVMDAIQDLFVELWDNKNRLGKVESIKSYLYKSIRRRLISQVKKERKLSSGDVDNFAIGNYPSAEISLIEKQQFDKDREELSRALTSLNKRQREIIHLKYYAQLSYSEISEILNINKKTAYSLMARSIEQLKQSLGGSWFIWILFFLQIPFQLLST